MKTFVFALVCVLSSIVFGQNANWITVTETNQYKVESKTVTIPVANNDFSMEMELLKITNKTASVMEFNYHLNAYYDNECRTCNNEEYSKLVTIPANSSVEYNENDKTLAKLGIFRQYINKKNYSNFTKFEVANININLK